LKKKALYIVLMIVFWVFTGASWILPDGIPGEEFLLPIPAIIFTILYINKREQLKKTEIEEVKYRKLFMRLMIICWGLTALSWILPDGIPGEEIVLPITAGIFTVLYVVKNQKLKKMKRINNSKLLYFLIGILFFR
jgi:hypothetical protein